MKKKLILVGVITLLLGWVIFIVPGGTPAAEEYKELRIGANCMLSGPAAGWGLPAYQGIAMRVDEINAAGGVIIGGEKYKLKLFAEDSKYEVGAATTAVEKLLYRDKVHVMWTHGGAPVLATQQKIEDLHMLNFILAWNDKQRGPKYPYTYSIGMIGPHFLPELLDWVLKNYPAKTAKCISQKTESGYYSERIFKQHIIKAGFEVLESEFFESGTSDFYPLIGRVTGSKTAIVFAASTTPRDVGILLKQRDELGAKFLVVDYTANPTLTMRFAPKACENDYIFRYNDFSWSPKAKAFEKRYQERWKEPADYNSQEGYDFVGVYAQAAQKAGKLGSDAVKAVLDDRTFEYEGLMGTYKWSGKGIYGRNCEMCYPICIAAVSGDKIKILARVSVQPK